VNNLPTESPWWRRIRALLIHIVGPLVVFLGFVSVTTAVHWHGVWTDSMAIIFIVVVNTWSIWSAKWNEKLALAWRIGITIVALFVSLLLMNAIAFNIRSDYG